MFPPSCRFPRFARGTKPIGFPLPAGGTLRRGLSTAVFCELRLGDWYDKGTSVEFAACGGCAFCVALTPSPSPTEWQRDVGAHGGSPDRAFPLARLWQRDVGAHGGSPCRCFPPSRACPTALAWGKKLSLP